MDSPIVCVRMLLCQRGLPHRAGMPGGGGMFASGAGTGLRVCAGCVAGTGQVCVVCAGRRVRDACGCACAGRGYVCVRPSGPRGVRGVGVCFQPDLDFRFFRYSGYCNFRNMFPDFISAKY